MLPIGMTPILTPGARVRLAQSAPPGPAAGKLAAQGRPSVSDFGSGLGAAILRQMRSEAVRRGEWTPCQHV